MFRSSFTHRTRTAASAVVAAALAASVLSGFVEPAGAQTDSGPAVPVQSAATNAIPGRYIVTLKAGENPRSVAAVAHANPTHVFENALNGFSAELNQGQLNALRHNKAVAAIEEDAVAEASTVETPKSWGLDRIDQTTLPLSNTYSYNRTGVGVRVYVLDKGIDTTLAEFGGRAVKMYDAVGGVTTPVSTCFDHGTHVAGTIASTSYGVAKGASIRGVRVLGCDGRGSWSDVIEGMDWVKANAIKPAVANMSLGGGKSAAVNTAATALSDSGVFVVVSAGNNFVDACTQSPASAARVTTVASTDSTDAISRWQNDTDAAVEGSNFGPCVDIYAPGSGIKSTLPGGSTGTWSGTSMASPHVAGWAAIRKAAGDAPSESLAGDLISQSTKGKVKNNPAGTLNNLLHKSSTM